MTCKVFIHTVSSYPLQATQWIKLPYHGQHSSATYLRPCVRTTNNILSQCSSWKVFLVPAADTLHGISHTDHNKKSALTECQKGLGYMYLYMTARGYALHPHMISGGMVGCCRWGEPVLHPAEHGAESVAGGAHHSPGRYCREGPGVHHPSHDHNEWRTDLGGCAAAKVRVFNDI